MKKEIASFFAGAAAVAFAVSLTTAAMASSGKVAFNQVNVDMLGKSVISKGDEQTTASGAKVPSSITYTDENGGATTYLPARTICDLFDADIDWYARTGTVELGGPEQSVTITIGTGDDDVPTAEEVYAKYPTEPELGVKAGEFTEIDPATVDKSGGTYILFKDARIQSAYGLSDQQYFCQSNSYVVITVTNNGQATESVFVYHAKTISTSLEKFSIVRVDPGKTITRAFRVGDVTQLTCMLSMNIDHPESQGDKSDITLSVEGYYIKK
ncbi:MAG: stalk domain-containing protein [Oscillospiraceae bacterium]|nr:stalk domain-containing protein [Oscillospiraceae bacterium]